MLHIENLTVKTEEKTILKGFSLDVKPGEIHAIMGPNGAGKSTLAKALAGHPHYAAEGIVKFQGEDLLEMDAEERARAGLFMGFQYPVEIAGITNLRFLCAAYNAVKGTKLTEEAFEPLLCKAMDSVGMPMDFLRRDVNSGFSGGEKKRNEILQMALLKPSLAILDETDSGLDIDAMRTIAEGVNRELTDDNALILITHYQRLLDYIQPHFVHIVVDGKIVRTGGPGLAHELETHGYELVGEAT